MVICIQQKMPFLNKILNLLYKNFLACALQVLGMDFKMLRTEIGLDNRKTKRRSRRRSSNQDDDDWEPVLDKNKDDVYLLRKLGNMHAARFFSRHLYCLHLLAHENLLSSFLDENPNDKQLAEIVRLLNDKKVKEKLLKFAKFSLIHVDIVMRSNEKESLINDYRQVQTVRKLLGEEAYNAVRKSKPGWFRNPELAMLIFRKKTSYF